MIKVQREILSEWRKSDITKLDELADSLEDLVECKIEVFGTQIICIEFGHACQLVRKLLYEVFNEKKEAWEDMSLGERLTDIEKKNEICP